MWYKNIAGRFFELVTKHACDRRTDGRTELRLQDRGGIAASRGNKSITMMIVETKAFIYGFGGDTRFMVNKVVHE